MSGRKIESHEVLVGGRRHGQLCVRVDADRPHGLGFCVEGQSEPVAVLGRVDVRALMEHLGSWLARGSLADPQMDAAAVWQRLMGIVDDSSTDGAGGPVCDCGKHEGGRHHSDCPVEVAKRRRVIGVIDNGDGTVREAGEGEDAVGWAVVEGGRDEVKGEEDRAFGELGDNDSWSGPDDAGDAGEEQEDAGRPVLSLPMFDRALARMVITLTELASMTVVRAQDLGVDLSQSSPVGDEEKEGGFA